MTSKNLLPHAWMHVRRKVRKISLIVSIVAIGIISTGGCSNGPPPNNCMNCGFYSFQMVIISYPNGGQQWTRTDESGCATVSTRTPCGDLEWTGLP